jgi:hypothetical protein
MIRSNHWARFRSGKWAEILTTVPAPDKTDCYMVRFPDGATDYWPVNDPVAEYEFSAAQSTAQEGRFQS